MTFSTSFFEGFEQTSYAHQQGLEGLNSKMESLQLTVHQCNSNLQETIQDQVKQGKL